MLSELHIENIAVIEKADISFEKGLNILSGETGAGKSIVIDSINAVLGNRTSRELVRKGADNALVSAVFLTDTADDWLRENDIDAQGELILQRRISAEGKSSCRVSGVPVTAAQMKELASLLVDVHGQNDGLRLLDEKSHLTFLNGFGRLEEETTAYKAAYRKYAAIAREIKSLSMDEDEKERLADSLRFRIDELTKANLQSGEYERLTSRRDLLRNSEKLREALSSALTLLSESDENAEATVQNALYYTERAAVFSPDLSGAVKSLKDAALSLRDAGEILSDVSERLDFSDEEYDELESRISLLDRLQKKYSTDEAGLIEQLILCREKLESLGSSSDKAELLKKELSAQKKILLEEGEKLSLKRRETAQVLEKRITRELTDLSMPSVRFTVDFDRLEKIDVSGIDDVKFLMSANAGEDPGRISKVASGGELSRIMLALKNAFAENDTVDTLIFDEIDTGVSGIAASRVAEKLWSVSSDKQVLVVTHLPQIAAMADVQFRVSKSESNGRTFTAVDKLDEEGRKMDIARLYGGDNISETTLNAAREALEASAAYKGEIK